MRTVEHFTYFKKGTCLILIFVKRLLIRKRFLLLLIYLSYGLTVSAQGIKVSGNVSDNEGVPLPGVNVIVKKTSNGTQTDFEGNYSITAEERDILVFSYIGFKTKEATVSSENKINIILEEDLAKLDEIVLIGYGKQKKSSLTAAVSVVDVNEIQKTQYTDATQALQGRAPGVSVSIGAEPGTSPKVQIRGIGSLTNQNPLYIIDGAFASSMESLSSNDIASIQILKDASAAAIYGSRAANGVIIIKTKGGSSGKMAIEFETNVGYQTPTNKMDLMDASQWASLSNDYADAIGSPRAPKNDIDFDPSQSYDYQDYFFSNAPVYSADLSFSGGDDVANFRASLGYLDQDGLQISSGFKRYTTRVNSNIKKGRYEMTQSLGFTRREQQTSSKYRDFYGKPTISPYADTPSGYGVIPSDFNVGGGTGSNSLISYDLTDNFVYSDNLIGSLNNSFEIIEGLKYHLNGSLNIQNGHNYNYRPTWVTLIDDSGKPIKDEAFNPTKAELNESWNRKLSYTIDNLLTYNKSFGSHNLDVLLGTSWNQESYRMSAIKKVGGFIDNSITVPSGEGTISGNDYKTALLSYFGRLNYDYDNRYLVSVSIRRDESSLFNSNNRVGSFPSGSLGWNIHKEPFFHISAINQLKIRASYGQIGANFISPYSYQTKIASNIPAIFGDENRELGTIEILSNKTLRWETSTTWDIGLETSFFGNKLYFEFDYYHKINSDLLARLEAAPSSGQGVYYGQNQGAYYNTAQISNKGFELQIGVRPTVNNLKFDMSLNLSRVKNKVEKLGENVQPISGGAISGAFDDRGTITKVGYPVSSFWGYTVDGIYQSDPGSEDAEPGKSAGDFIFRDISGPDGVPDGKITEDDKSIIGNPWPDLELGFSLGIKYKNWDLTAFLQGTFGNDIFYFLKNTSYFSYGNNLVTDASDYWSPDNLDAKIPRLMAGQMGSMNARPNSWHVEDGSYVRLKVLQIGYSFSDLEDKWDLTKLRLYVNIDNLFTITKFSGLDPEVTSVMGTGLGLDDLQDTDKNFLFNRGMVVNEYPRPRIIGFGIKVEF